jgi:hypothetical protein
MKDIKFTLKDMIEAYETGANDEYDLVEVFWDVINENAFDETLTTYREIRAALNEKGRLKNGALVHLLNRQTADEQQINDTRYHNERGFTPSDARRGSITAKYYIKHKRLEDWQQDYWLQPNVKGCARIGKYYRQIAEEAAKRLTNT